MTLNKFTKEVNISIVTRLSFVFPIFGSSIYFHTIFITILQKLYNLGAQKIVLMSLYPMGCSPLSIAAAQPKRKGCNKSQNEAALLYNAKLRAIVKGIKPQKPGPDVVMVNAYKIIRDIIRSPASNGKNM